uniref:Uncharacterized protein n=1 Tax=Timema tahoe TaxID=61484 RepID=A0A7R9FM74_9NEOP|nr:unnamed protein product [Timema tahoe]
MEFLASIWWTVHPPGIEARSPLIIGSLVYSDALDHAVTEVSCVDCFTSLDRASIDQLRMACRAVITVGRSNLDQPDGLIVLIHSTCAKLLGRTSVDNFADVASRESPAGLTS